jgi:hypothetical protein
MIHLCPFCGHNLKTPILNGIASCNNCARFFDSSPFHRLLSAAWLVRRKDIVSRDHLESLGFGAEEADLVITFVEEECYNHEEFMQVLKERDISRVFQKWTATP